MDDGFVNYKKEKKLKAIRDLTNEFKEMVERTRKIQDPPVDPMLPLYKYKKFIKGEELMHPTAHFMLYQVDKDVVRPK